MTSRTIALVVVMPGLVAGLAAMPSSAHEIEAGAIVIVHPWARATGSPQRNGAAYMVIRNQGASPDRLLAARTGEAQSAGLHGSTVTPEGIARMRPVEAVEIPPKGEARLAPGGLHVMLGGLRGQLHEGTMFPLTLVFERAGEVQVEVEVTSGGRDVEHGAGHPREGH